MRVCKIRRIYRTLEIAFSNRLHFQIDTITSYPAGVTGVKDLVRRILFRAIHALDKLLRYLKHVAIDFKLLYNNNKALYNPLNKRSRRDEISSRSRVLSFF